MRIIILITFLTFILASNLRKEGDIINSTPILENIVSIYNSLYQKILKEKIEIEKDLPINILKDLTTDYFKKVESSSKIKFYLNKDSTDFDSILDDIILSMKIPDTFASQIFKYKIPEHPEAFYKSNSINFNLLSTANDDNNIISYGSLYIIKNGDKYSFILCYGFGEFNRIFNGYNSFDLGRREYHESHHGAATSSKYFPNSIEEYYLMHFMNLVGLKVLGNKYNIDLPYLDFN